MNNTVSVSEYFKSINHKLHELEKGKTKRLDDPESKAGSKVYVKAMEDKIFTIKPDGELIPEIQGQKKCDHLIYVENKPQICFFELKGKKITESYKQISDTIDYLKKKCKLSNADLHAFIVSNHPKKHPRDIDSEKRILLGKLGNEENYHEVKVIKEKKYSDNGSVIICSHNSPIPMPYTKK